MSRTFLTFIAKLFYYYFNYKKKLDFLESCGKIKKNKQKTINKKQTK